eukprot:TRINITY_DN3861_c0_g1_i1.p1 TRINITY_DN3861_c0_g1~~TRINITY_DN3861_c0_g1_i1.p1  ORF type:complete len:149 (-),score=26.46 TRINITY_DN3861_c0_g1_i1:8-454(-)
MIRTSVTLRSFLTRGPTRPKKRKRVGFTNIPPWKRDSPKPLEPLKYPLQDLPVSDKPSGWMDAIGNTEHLPFRIKRTKSKQLPVYSDIKNGGSVLLTVVRKYDGDVKELKEELSRLLGGAEVVEHVGRLEVKGHHVADIKLWLRRLGF